MNQQSQKPEASTLSLSQLTGLDATNKKDIITGNTSTLDHIFPLIDEMLKRTKMPPFMYQILMLWVVIQIICLSFWISIETDKYDMNDKGNLVTVKGFFENDTKAGNVMSYIFIIAFFTKNGGVTNEIIDLVPPLIIFALFAILYYGMIVFQLLVYHKNRRFIRWTLYINRFLMDFIPVLLLIPCGNFLGRTLMLTIKNKGGINIIFVALGFVFWIGFAFGHFLMTYLFSGTSYISSSPTACWQGFIHFIFPVLLSFFPILSYLIGFFQHWMYYVIFIAKIAFSIYVIWETTYLPFSHLESNSILGTVFMATIPLDIASFVMFYGIKIETLYRIIIAIAGFIVSMGILTTVHKSIIKRVHFVLSDSYLETISDDDLDNFSSPLAQNNNSNNASSKVAFAYLTDNKKRKLFEKLKIDRSQRLAEMYFMVGLAMGSHRFVDWSLLKYAVEYHPSERITCRACQFIAYFPSEIRLLNYFFMQACRLPSLHFQNRFMLFEVHHSKTLRQSSASSEITDKLMSMKAMSMRGIRAAQSFWETVPRDINLLYHISQQTKMTAHLYEEAIDMWPNNCRLCEEYSKFLSECATDFVLALKYKNRGDLIEQGKNFVCDISFRSFVQSYPHYLKKKIVDTKGNVLINANRHQANKGNISQTSSNSSSQGQNSSFGSSFIKDDLEAELEEQLAKASFSYHRLRLALQRCLDHRKSENSTYLKCASVFSLLALIVIIVALFAWLFGIFNPRAINMDRQRLLNNLRYGYDATFVTILMHWMNKRKIISDTLFGNASTGLAMRSPKTNLNNIQFSTTSHPFNTTSQISHRDFAMMDEAQKWIIFSRNNLDTFLDSVIDFAADGGDAGMIMNNMINRVVRYHFCENINSKSVVNDRYINESLRSEIVFNLLKMGNLTKDIYVEANDWHLNPGICEAVINTKSMFEAFNELTDTLSEDQIDLNNKVKEKLFTVLGIVCGIYVLFVMPPIFIFLHKSVSEIYNLLDIMKSFDKSVKDEAARPFKATSENDQDVMSETPGRGGLSTCFLNVNVVVYSIFAIGILMLILFITQMMNDSFLELNNWLFFGISRGNYMVESFAYASLSIILAKFPGLITYIDLESAISAGEDVLHRLINYNNNILRGTTGLKPCTGQNHRLDALHFSDDCHGNLNLGGFHDFYRCAGIDRGISLFNVLVSGMLAEPKNVTIAPNQPFYHAWHMMNCHLIDPTYEASMILSELASSQINLFHTVISGICFGGIVLLILIFIIFISNVLRLDTGYSGCMQLLKRLPPHAVVSNPELLCYLLNKKHKDKSESKMTASMKVIFKSKDPILCISKNESIEIVTKSVTSIFGFTPDQLLGQSLSMVLPEEDEKNQKIFEQIKLMRNGEASLTFDASGQCINDNDQEILVHVIVLGSHDNSSKNAKSFVIILRDETEINEQRQAAEAAKKKSEELLYQILPRDIVVRLNQGEKDISFAVPSATVVFCDIVKFSDYASNLTPAQIMEHLSMVFAAFDISAAKYPLLTKIKLIGDVYMAAANLFTPDEVEQTHATQTIQFGLDVLNDLEEVNSVLNSSLSVRIGINTDGPLLAGVLGTDKPVFDIIGDTINVAARLQSNAIANTIQISQTTYDAVQMMHFNIEERGMIELKGKGKRMAYIVRPADHGSFFVPDPQQAT